MEKNFSGGEFLCAQGTKLGCLQKLPVMELANLKAGQIITMKRVVLPSVLGKFQIYVYAEVF